MWGGKKKQRRVCYTRHRLTYSNSDSKMMDIKLQGYF